MDKLKERIYIESWLDLKPYDSQTPLDGYYLKLCNDIKKSIITNKQSFVLQIYLDNDEIDVLACFLTSYFKDLISEISIWNTFINRSFKTETIKDSLTKIKLYLTRVLKIDIL